MEKKTYYIAVHDGEITDIDTPTGEHKYEIEATNEEIKEIEILISRKRKHSGDATKFLAKPFNEQGVDNERQSHDDEQKKIYKMIYKLGTLKTKNELNELGILER